jgi:putative addiction module component (TIGR02574 family)
MSSDYRPNLSSLSVAERLALLEQVWDSLHDEDLPLQPTPEQEAELDRRWADYLANPDDVLTWDEVQARVRARLAACR